MTGMSKRTYLREVNPYLICPLCRGYLIDATTVVECLHSFCRSCILKHLRSEAQCPSCSHLLNKAKPNIKADKALQDIVYKLVPGLYHKEMRKRREFYKKHPEHADSATPEQRGEDVSGRLIFAPEDAISLSLEYLLPGADPLEIISNTNDTDTSQSNTNCLKSNNKNDTTSSHDCNRRYLQCPALVTIAHLKKFLALKYSVDVTRYAIDICHRRAPLPEHWTLMDVAYIYAWKRNAPLRFFYRIMQEEQKLEAPSNDRPSTPGVGASLPAVENDKDKNESCDHEKPKKEEVTAKVNDETKKEDVKSELSVPSTAKSSDTKLDKKHPSLVPNESAKADKLSQSKIVEEETKQIKSPIKILKNSDGRYEVRRTFTNQTTTEVRNNSNEKKSTSPEFSVVSIGEGPNSNGVKITLKQCSPGTISSRPKIVSNILMKNGQTDKILKQEKSRQKGLSDKQEKHKRKVTFLDKEIDKETNKEWKNANNTLTEQSDKKQFLHGFRLTAKQPRIESADTDASPKEIDKLGTSLNSLPKPANDSTLTKSPEKYEKCVTINETKNSLKDTVVNSSVKNKSPEKASSLSLHTDSSFNSPKRLINGITKDEKISDNDPKVDVYAFPSEPPTLPAGAVKRKCPPGLPIFDVNKKRAFFQGQIRKKSPSTSPLCSAKIAKKQEAIFPAKKFQPSKDNPPIGIGYAADAARQTNVPPTFKLPAPAISDNTRNLLDGCGLNIPASLSITLTAPKSPSQSGSSVDTNNLKDNQIFSGKVNPSITLNDRSVDPRVLKALKTGQIRMPVPSSKPKAKPASERNQPAKRKRDVTRDILDLSGTRNMDNNPIRIPQPISKFKSKPTRENTSSAHSASSQVVTLTGGQKYYRAPPGSLTPAVHRVSDYTLPPPARAPVYAPSCFSSPHSNSRSSNNISSVFPSLQSLYALSQAPNLQQFQMDSRLRLPQPESTTSSGSGKSHLAAQCAPLKPARSSFASLAVPIVKQSSSMRPLSLTAGIAQANKLIKNKGSSKSELTAKRDSSQNSSLGKQSPSLVNSNRSKDSEMVNEKSSRSSSSPILSHSKQEASASNGVDLNLHEAASPRVSSTVSPSPPPPPPTIPAPAISFSLTDRNSSAENPPNTDKISSDSTCNKSGSEVTSSKSPESPDSSSIVNENSNNASGTTAGDQLQPSPKEDESDNKSVAEKLVELITKSEGNISSESSGKEMDSVKVDVKQMTSEVFQKRLMAAFPSDEWKNNPIAAKTIGNFLKKLTQVQTDDKTESTKVQPQISSGVVTTKCVKDDSSKNKVKATD